MVQMTSCTEAQMYAWVKAYPRKLTVDVYAVAEPPYVTFNDFTLGDWPDSVVASFHAGDLPGESKYYGPASKHCVRTDLVPLGI